MPKITKHYQLILLTIVMLTAVFFRFWQIRDYVVFLGDEGRDMIVMRDIFTSKRLPFLGPTASVGGFYLGPIYYWMAAPFLYFARFDPVGPAYFVAIIGVATVFLLYKFLKEAVGFWPALLVSSLYATAPLIVRYSRSSWNPNPLPFFALLMIYLIYLGITRKKSLFFLGAGACFGIAVQLHYLASILGLIAALIVLTNVKYKSWPKIIILSVVGFIVTFSPFLAFEIRHNFPNFRTILEFVTRGSTAGFKSANFILLISSLGNTFLEEISAIRATIVTKVFFWILTIGGIIGLYLYRTSEKKLIFSIGLIWFLAGLLGLRLYTGQIFDYYFGFMFPAPFLLVGLILYLLWNNIIPSEKTPAFKPEMRMNPRSEEKRTTAFRLWESILRTLGIVVVGIIVWFFLNSAFYTHEPNRIIDQTEEIAGLVIEKTEGQPFNFALISDSNSDHAYRYFLEIKENKPVGLETLVTDQLLVICESKICEPLGHPIWEIAGFGRAEITNQWETRYGIKIFHLVHWPGAPSPVGRPAVKGS